MLSEHIAKLNAFIDNNEDVFTFMYCCNVGDTKRSHRSDEKYKSRARDLSQELVKIAKGDNDSNAERKKDGDTSKEAESDLKQKKAIELEIEAIQKQLKEINILKDPMKSTMGQSFKRFDKQQLIFWLSICEHMFPKSTMKVLPLHIGDSNIIALCGPLTQCCADPKICVIILFISVARCK
ncbi:hypothetical protein RFI_22271 [Reticulomyxa filosa]|uniref:Uncharacterized protein n=1 Tax=Reticulomyxa filosa TaxID=46433 RepID=X6MM49_RETFI|nr:hypothetical protein RFI_22271 [Reticulomyxa filosa]|eukprot:ETO15093.1 hypothetical protein RFI_22271 [Reticulomyxa filosa]